MEVGIYLSFVFRDVLLGSLALNRPLRDLRAQLWGFCSGDGPCHPAENRQKRAQEVRVGIKEAVTLCPHMRSRHVSCIF